MSFEFLDHTADIRVRIEADSKKELFKEGVFALNAVVFGDNDRLSREHKDVVKDVHISAVDLPSLFVDWLNEILFLQKTLYGKAMHIQIAQLTDNNVKAVVKFLECEPIEEIKAVTYNDLICGFEGGKWIAEVTFDI